MAASNACRPAGTGSTCAAAPSAATSAAATTPPASTRPRISTRDAHPIIQSFEPGEDWYYCYVDDLAFELDGRRPEPVTHLESRVARRSRRRSAGGRWLLAPRRDGLDGERVQPRPTRDVAATSSPDGLKNRPMIGISKNDSARATAIDALEHVLRASRRPRSADAIRAGTSR